ncbi:hypothetical protein NQ314_020592, partial [Rhamnusium bicolor]
RKAEKKKSKKDAQNPVLEELSDKQRNPKAFAFNSAIRAERRFRRKQDIETKKQHIPLVDRTPIEPPPILIAVVGPPKVGKSTLINNLIKLFTRTPLTDIKGPVTIVTGKKTKAKVADLVLLLCDASFGFEMEIFEFLNICQVHGMPRIMGILTHLDMIKNTKSLKLAKKTLKHRFWTEVYPGAKLFYLSGILHGEYLRNEIKNLGRFISVMKFRPLQWRTTHRLGDLKIHDVSYLPDPCPLPEQIKKRALIEKEKLIYAPFSGVGGIVYDKDAVYVELGGSHSHHKREGGNELDNIVAGLIDPKEPLDIQLEHSEMQIFTGGMKITAKDLDNNEHKIVENIQLYEKKLTNKEDTELEEELNELRKKNFHNVHEEEVEDSGRTRRKVIFETADDDFAKTVNDDDSDDNSEDVEENEKEINHSLEYTNLKENKYKGIHSKVSNILKELSLKEEKSGNITSDDDSDTDLSFLNKSEKITQSPSDDEFDLNDIENKDDKSDDDKGRVFQSKYNPTTENMENNSEDEENIGGLFKKSIA